MLKRLRSALYRFLLAAGFVLLTGCHMTAAQAALLESAAAGAACKLLPLADKDIPPGIEVAACAMADGTTPAPESVAAVKAKVTEVAAQPPTSTSSVMVHGHGVIVDRRAVMAVAPAVKK